jgi:hypothetical protein
MATAELAASLPVVVLLLVAGLTAVNAVATEIGCIDAARDVALAVARGASRPADHLPPGARVSVNSGAGQVSVTVTAPVLNGYLPGLTVSGHAVAPMETS